MEVVAFPRALASVAPIGLALGGMAFVACGRSAAEAPSSQHHHAMTAEGSTAAPAPAEASPVTGHEHFAWTVPADSVAGHRFAVYADGVRSELPGAVCHPTVSGQADCESPLPSLPSGKHTLEVVSWMTDTHGQVLESGKSPPILIVVSSGSAGAAGPKDP
jgi:hypothetical protein